jgi:2-polyprenyl-6-methoxyphenol hydroxylase-like FAD-dependent oxidoreductase
MADREVAVRCCIAGGGPAGMMLGLLLARAGVPVLVLEKHADFLRDFRGDTIHPSTLEIIYELGLLDDFLRCPHQEVRTLGAQIGEDFVEAADFTRLPTHCRFLALMPQWDFLDFVAGQARRYPRFQLMTRAEVTDLVEEAGKIVGLRATTPEGTLTVRAELVVGADGRHSTVRRCAGLAVKDLGTPMDVLWTRLSRRPDDGGQTLGRVDAGRILVMLNRGDYWQCAYVIAKGGFEEIRQRGLGALREEIARLAPQLAERTTELRDWDDVKLLSVTVDRLPTWHRPGLLCIGDAAHAMSPIGGVGINLAIQDAVAAANLLYRPLLSRNLSETDLHAVQARREFPTRATQKMQLIAQNRLIGRVLAGRGPVRAPRLLRLASRSAYVKGLTARLIGLGFRPEHVMAPAAAG